LPPCAAQTEGNAAHWMWAVPHNMSALVASFPGGADEYAEVLRVVLANQSYWTDALSTFMPNPWAWLGNEPSMLLPWSHAWAGATHAPSAAYWPRWHLRTYYAPTIDMIPGASPLSLSLSLFSLSLSLHSRPALLLSPLTRQ
jgi:putative alpha-1,2-mannosidase